MGAQTCGARFSLEGPGDLAAPAWGGMLAAHVQLGYLVSTVRPGLSSCRAGREEQQEESTGLGFAGISPSFADSGLGNHVFVPSLPGAALVLSPLLILLLKNDLFFFFSPLSVLKANLFSL